MSRNVFIMRGIPGAGKSTFIPRSQETVVVSADSYHMKDGTYRFDPKRAGYAHNECLREFLGALQEGCETVFVDNTNTTAWEIAPYYRLAELFAYQAEIITILCPIEIAIARNVHDVPATTILQMHRNILTEVLPAHWKHTVRVYTAS